MATSLGDMTIPNTSTHSAAGGIEPRLAIKRLCWLFLGCYFLIWIVLPWCVDRQPPNENTAVLAAARTLAWFYPERSTLAAWTAYFVFLIVPASAAATYVLGAIYIAIMLYCAWLLAREIMDARCAMLAVLFITCCTYYTNRLHFFNGNAALTAVSAVAVLSLWRALNDQEIRWWWVTGVLWGIGLLAKPLMVVTIACGFVAVATIEPRRDRPSARRVLLAIAACIIVIAPTAIAWLRSEPTGAALHIWHELLPFLARPRRMADFSADQLLRVVPLLFLIVILLRTRSMQAARAVPRPIAVPSLKARRFLAVHAWGALIAILALGLLGWDLRAHWGTAFLWLLPVWFLSTRCGARFASMDFEHVLVCVALTHVVMVVGYVLDW